MQLYGHGIDPHGLLIGISVLIVVIMIFTYKRNADDIWNRLVSVIEFLVSLIMWQISDMFLFLFIFTFTSGSEYDLYLRYYLGRVVLFMGIIMLVIFVEKH
ncbi:MAG: hypothetical protein JW779_14610 [Candidatus Thorarchaeota archaeon]|nr:hypothetical protein [Candidatus Thorarchaeota archaeon]